MKRIDPSQAISLLANVGVIAGIVFLAVELRQNNDLLRSQALAARTEGKQAVARQLVDNEVLGGVLVKARGGEALLPQHNLVLVSFYEQVLTHWQFSFLEYQANRIELEDLDLEGWRYWFNEAFPLLPENWATHVEQGRFRQDFREFMEENVIAE
jgi:hypothetical protein